MHTYAAEAKPGGCQWQEEEQDSCIPAAGMQAALVVRGIQRDEAGRGLTILGNRRRVRTRYSCRASRLLEPAEELGLAEELS
jgi:hypothetical protein